MIIGIVAVVMVLYCGLLWNNNHDVPYPERDVLERSLERGIEWLVDHRYRILRQNNQMLWWMVRESSTLCEDPRLQSLFSSYEKRYVIGKRAIWNHFFDEGMDDKIHYRDVERYPYYIKYFAYALTCGEELGRVPIVKAQNDPRFCDQWRYRIHPTCVSHQLMGFRIRQRRNCGDQAAVVTGIKVLQGRLMRQLEADVRVLDVYIQRVLMLVDTGARGRVKPSWLGQVLRVQGEDGGWGDFDPRIRVTSVSSFGFTRYGVGIGRPKATFHATAQAVLLLSELLEKE